jgi:hypothetical protein
VSGIKPVGTELLYSYYGAATVSTPTASPGSSMIVGYPPVVVPAAYMGNTGNWSSSLKLKMGGQLTITATIPTWQFLLYAAVATTSAPAFATTMTVSSTAAITPGAISTAAWWTMEIDIGLRTLALGATSTIAAWGEVRSPALATAAYAATTPFDVTMPALGAYTAPNTWDTTQAYVLWPALAVSAGTAGNTVTTEFLKLYGEN